MSDEQPENLFETLKLLKTTAREWASVPNFEGEEEFRKKADFRILIEKSQKAINDIKKIDD